MTNTHTLFFYVKYAVIVELIILVTLILIAYGLKVIFKYHDYFEKERNEKLKLLLTQVASHPDQTLSNKNIKLIYKDVATTLKIFEDFDQSRNLPNWQTIRAIIIVKILIPKSKKLAASRYWLHRFYATVCLQYYHNREAEKLVLKLIDDPAFLVSMNASKIAMRFPHEAGINKIIDTYSMGRRLQQSTFSSMMGRGKKDNAMVPIIFHRIQSEKNPYVKTFCYRLLTNLPFFDQLSPGVEDDLKDKNRDLQITILEYLAYYARHIDTLYLIRERLQSQDWQVRAVAAKLLGNLQDEQSLPLLKILLSDQQWWVRSNAARALLKLGEPGIKVLKSQHAEEDRSAFEVSQYVLGLEKDL